MCSSFVGIDIIYVRKNTLPDTAEFKALLLIVREWQHHMGFTQALLLTE